MNYKNAKIYAREEKTRPDGQAKWRSYWSLMANPKHQVVVGYAHSEIEALMMAKDDVERFNQKNRNAKDFFSVPTHQRVFCERCLLVHIKGLCRQ